MDPGRDSFKRAGVHATFDCTGASDGFFSPRACMHEMLDGDAVTSITPQPTLVDNNCLGRNNDRFVSPSCAREVMAKLTRRRAIYAHASAGDTREPANTPHRSSAGRLACAKTQRRNLVSLSWIRFSPTLYNMAVSVCSHTFFPERSGSRPTPKISLFRRFLHALPLKRQCL